MADTLDWLCYQIGARKDEILSARMYRDLVIKRKIIVVFFHLLKKSTTWIGNVIGRDHSTIVSVLKNIPDSCHNRALELYQKYETEINGRNIEELKVEAIKRTVLRRVPDYKHSCVIMKEFDVSDDFIQGLPPLKNNSGWNK